jgi:hypothetical protein
MSLRPFQITTTPRILPMDAQKMQACTASPDGGIRKSRTVFWIKPNHIDGEYKCQSSKTIRNINMPNPLLKRAGKERIIRASFREA